MRYGVGIDISKGKSTIAIVNEKLELEQKVFEVKHDLEDLEKLSQILTKIGKEDIKIVMEQTGNYYLPVYKYLRDSNFFVVAENAYKVNKYLDREIRKSKTDKKDAKKLGEYAIENWVRLEQREREAEKYIKLRFLSRQYNVNMSLQTKARVDLSNLCDLVFPGYYELITTENQNVALDILKKYYHSDLVKKLSQEEFLAQIEKMYATNKHLKAAYNLGKKIHSLSQKCIPSYDESLEIKLAVENKINILIECLNSTNTIIAEMEKIAINLREYEEIISIPGIGKVLGVRLIAEIGDARRFKNAGSLIAYAGIDSPAYQSGNINIEGINISKRGNKYLRKVGYEIMFSIKKLKEKNRIGNSLYEYMVKKENEGKSKKEAKIAGFNKFLRMYYGIVKRIDREEENKKVA